MQVHCTSFYAQMYNKGYIVRYSIFFVYSHFKGECERHASSRQELIHKLSELTTHCKEVERQHDEEAENCRFLKVHLIYLTIVVQFHAGQLPP